jgi:glycosyltransferase involved in cell wall biosynthesis
VSAGLLVEVNRSASRGPQAGEIALSVVVPIFNEEENISELYEGLTRALGKLGASYELIIVDDGSTDGSFDRSRRFAERDPRVRVLRFARNCGQHVALAAGIERAGGNIVILMDADLQNDPEDIQFFVAKIQEGADLVSGWRTDRQGPGIARRVGSVIVDGLITVSTGVALRDHNCGFKAMTRRVAVEISRYGHLRRFLPLLLLTLARSVAEVPVADHPRRHGRSKYNITQLLGLTLEFVIAFSTRPFRIIGSGGVLAVLAGLAAAVTYLAGRLAFGLPPSDRILAAVVFLTFGGLQFTILGLLGEYTVRAYHAAQALPLYVIEDEIGGS